jgi:hypothetical protein
MALGGFGVTKIGYVNLSTLGSALLVLSLMLDSIVPNTSCLFLSFSLTGGIGGGLLSIPYLTVLYSQMSGPMLPVAVGFAAAGGGVGTIVFNSTLEPLHQTFGWRHARQILAAALLVILTLNTLVLRCCTRQKQESPDDSMEESNSASSDTSSGSQPSQFRLGRELVELVRPFAAPSFGLLSVGLVLYMCGFTVPYTHVVYYAELQGYKKAATLVSVMGAGSTVGRMLCSFDVLLADMLWKFGLGNPSDGPNFEVGLKYIFILIFFGSHIADARASTWQGITGHDHEAQNGLRMVFSTDWFCP